MMRDKKRIASHIASFCPFRGDRCYTKIKILSDPLYEGVYQELENRNNALLDVGCGLGILALYLRERGWLAPCVGFDYDQRKIEDGKKIIALGIYQNIQLIHGDARVDLPPHQGDVTILDILQFFEPTEQEKFLRTAAKKVCPGGKLILRSGLRQKNLRFFLTWLGDVFAKVTFWMKAAPTHYPTAQFFHTVLEDEGFALEIRPFWGKTPFNNYLIVATRMKD